MKKLFPLVFTLSLIFSLSSCGKQPTDSVRAPNSQTTPSDSTKEPALQVPEVKTPEVKSVNANGTVEYSLVSSKKKVAVGESFSVDVLMNTKSETVVSGQVYLTLDGDMFDVEDINTKESDFPMWLDRSYLDTLRLTFANQDGIKKTQAKVTTLTLKAKKTGSSEISFITDQTIASTIAGGNVTNMKKLEGIKINVN